MFKNNIKLRDTYGLHLEKNSDSFTGIHCKKCKHPFRSKLGYCLEMWRNSLILLLHLPPPQRINKAIFGKMDMDIYSLITS